MGFPGPSHDKGGLTDLRRFFNEGFSSDFGGLGGRVNEDDKALPLGEGFGRSLGWKLEVSDSCEMVQKRNTFKCEG